MTSRDTVKCLPELDRPYERAELFGIKTLTDAELLAVIVKSGTKNKNAIDVSRELLQRFDGELGAVCKASVSELMQFEGIGKVKAIQIKAAGEFAARITARRIKNKMSAENTKNLGFLMSQQMSDYRQEIFRVLLLDSRLRVFKIKDISLGTVDRAIIHPREVFFHAVRECCSHIVIVHNHPSGDVSPSVADIETTRLLVSAGMILGIAVFDHIIVGNGEYHSMRTSGELDKLHFNIQGKSQTA